MPAPAVPRRQKLSVRLGVLAGGLFLLLAIILPARNVNVAEEAWAAREREHLRLLEVLAPSALAPALLAGDNGRIAETLDRLRGAGAFAYLAVIDNEQRIVAASGWDTSRPLPSPTIAMPLGAARYDAIIMLHAGDRRLGALRYGVDLGRARSVRSEALRDSLILGLATAAVGVLLMALFGVRLSDGLTRVRRGLEDLERGSLPAKLPVRGPEELRNVIRALNRCAQTLESRIESLRQGESQFHSIADYTFGVEAWFNPRGRLLWINRSIERVTGFTPVECVLAGNLVETLVYPKDRKFAVEAATEAFKGSTSGSNLELRLQKKDGDIVWVRINWQASYDAAGAYLGLRVSIDEIQQRKEAELKLLETVAELRRAQSLKEYYLTRSNEERLRLEALLDVMKIGVLFVDRDHRVRYCNKSMLRMWNMDVTDNLTGVRDAVLLERTQAQLCEPQEFRSHVDQVLGERETSVPYDVMFRDGRILNDVSAPVLSPEPGRYLGRVWIYEDVTEQRRWAERLTQLAERDPLTNLYNRRRFGEETQRMIADAERRGVQLGLLVLDLDGFKPINDEFGHQAGDSVLVQLAAEVGGTVRRNEMFFRLGGDEFAILAPDTDEAEMEGLARRVASRIEGLCFDFSGQKRHVSASLGIALFPRDAAGSEELLSGADQAMYDVKAAGKSGWKVYRRPPPLRSAG